MIHGTVVGADAVIVRLEQVNPKVMVALVRAVDTEVIDLVGYIKSNKLSGAVLKKKTGTLRRDVNPSPAQATDTEVVGAAGFNVGYGRVHEYGGTFTIREHMRMMKTVFGRPVKAPRQITVRAHSATFPERSFMRSSLRERTPRIKAALERAVAEGIKT